MKKWFSLVFSMIICAVFLGVTPCSASAGVCMDWLQDPRIIGFVQDYVWRNEDRFVFDEWINDVNTDAFDRDNGVYTMTYSDARNEHTNEVNRLLSEGENVVHNSRMLADWALCELRGRGVPCKEIEIGYREPLHRHFAVLVLQVERDGATRWYVCDVYNMSKCKKDNCPRYECLLFAPLEEYIGCLGENFRGIMVTDEEYTYRRDGISIISGHDIFCWLASEGYEDTAIAILIRQRHLRMMTGVNYHNYDLREFDRLSLLAGRGEEMIDAAVLY